MPVEPSIVFVNQHYWPDMAASGQHLADLAEHLASSHLRVTVLCGHASYVGEARVEAPDRQIRRGVEIVRLKIPTYRRSADSVRTRSRAYATFHARAARYLASAPPPDLVVSLTTPSLLPFTLGIVCRTKGIPYGIWAMDLHPDAEERLGLVPGGTVTRRALRMAAASAYRGAGFVVALGPHMGRRILSRGVAPERLHQITAWNRKDEIWPIPPEQNPLRSQLGYAHGDFVAMYSGNAGLAHRFDEVLVAMERLRDHPDVHFLFVGGGPRRPDLEEEAALRGIPRFRYRDYAPREQLAFSLSAGDLHLVTLRNDLAGMVAPSKVFGIMAAGRPIVMVGPRNSEPGAAIADAGAGEVIEPTEDASLGGARLATGILRIKDSPDLRRQLGERARRAFLGRYEKQAACRRWESLIEQEISQAHRHRG